MRMTVKSLRAVSHTGIPQHSTAHQAAARGVGTQRRKYTPPSREDEGVGRGGGWGGSVLFVERQQPKQRPGAQKVAATRAPVIATGKAAEES